MYICGRWRVQLKFRCFFFFIVVDGVLLVATRRSTGILSYPHIHIASWAYEERIRVERGASRRSSSLSFIPIFSVGFELGISLFVFFFFFRFYWLRSLVTHSRSSNSSLPWIWYGGVNVDNLYCVWTHGRVGQWLVAVRRTELQNKFNEKRNMRDYTLKWSLR